jgi:uncharacterized RDD family membrane protein YckC
MNEVPSEYESASVLQRFLAQAIDFAVIVILFCIPAVFESMNDTIALFIGIVLVLIALTYRILGDGIFGGAGLGKRIAGIYVIDAATRNPCSLSQAAVRMSPWFVPFGCIIEPILLVCDGQQRWGDRMAKTYVLRRKPKRDPTDNSRPLRPINFEQLRHTLEAKRPEQ